MLFLLSSVLVLSRECFEHGRSLEIYGHRALMIWQFIQLFPLDIVDEFAVPDDGVPVPILTQLFSVVRFFKGIFFRLFEWGDLLLIVGSIAAVLYTFIYTIANFIYREITNTNLPDKRYYVWKAIFDVFYVTILEAILNIFVCTYSCKFDPNNPPNSPYPPYDLYTEISCSSPLHIFLFSLGTLALGFFHWRASHFIVMEEWKNSDNEDDFDEQAFPDKFRYAECILRVCFHSLLPLHSYILSPVLCFCFFYHILLVPSPATHCQFRFIPYSPMVLLSTRINRRLRFRIS